MLTRPLDIMRVLSVFAPLFSQRVFTHVQVLLMGALLVPGRRTVASVLRIMVSIRTGTCRITTAS